MKKPNEFPMEEFMCAWKVTEADIRDQALRQLDEIALRLKITMNLLRGTLDEKKLDQTR